MTDALPRAHHGQTHEPDAVRAVTDFHAQVCQPDMSAVLFFCSGDYDLDVVADQMTRLFGDVPVIGCTTAGEIGPEGYLDRSLTGVSLPTDGFVVASGRIDDLGAFDAAAVPTFVGGLSAQLGDAAGSTFAFLLIDGLSVREEPVAAALQRALGGTPLVGGSAGDGVAFGETHVYADGAFRTDSAVVTLVRTPLPFRVFKTQHFVTTDQRVVVTGADAARRIVFEIDGRPAVETYADLVGIDVDRLDPAHFASQPVVVLIDSNDYVRSIQKANPDGSLTFYCAIEEGVVLRTAVGVDLVENLAHAFDTVRADIGSPQLVLGCDCILRKLEMTQRHLTEPVADLFRANRVVGFSSYGEQYRGLHVNQTFTGVAIGAPDG